MILEIAEAPTVKNLQGSGNCSRGAGAGSGECPWLVVVRP